MRFQLNRSWLVAITGLLVFVSLAGVYAVGLGIRRAVLESQRQLVGVEMPFTLESALHYRRIKMMYDRGFLPDVDPAIQYPEGIRIREIDSIASEPVQAFLARWFPDDIPFPERIRWIEAGWFCLSLPLLALFLRVWTGSWIAGLIASLVYAISLAGVLRSTGQEISRENFSWPWLLAGYLFAAGFMKAKARPASLAWAMGAAASLGLALISWDMIQYVIGVLALGMSVHVIQRGRATDKKVAQLFIWLAASVLAVGIVHPYYRYHGLAASPLMIWLVSIIIASRLVLRASPAQGEWSTGPARWKIALVVFSPMALFLLVGFTWSYGAAYDHFAQLFWAKLRFLNVKPEDPALLTYYQRVMWVPSLHSATWELTKWLFPLALWPSVLVAVAAFIDSSKRYDPLLRHWILLLAVSLAAYVLFVRFHVFVALAVSVLLGWCYGRLRYAHLAARGAVLLLAGWVGLAEARHTWLERDRMGRPNVYYEELRDLANWLRDHVAPDPVLANMGVSAYIAAYGKCPIAIHPKFEDPVIRQRLRHYGELMFGDDELALRNWMDELDIRYLVYAKGEFAREKPEYQMRYFVNRMNPPETSPARRFERDDESMRYFTRLWGNRKYVVYRVLSGADEKMAEKLGTEAMEAFTSGQLDLAEAKAAEALMLDREQSLALQVIRHVGSLRAQGVRGERDEVAP